MAAVSVLAKNTCQSTGEGPYWEECTKSLVYVDIFDSDVHRWSTLTNCDSKIHISDSDTVSFIIPRAAGGYVVGLGRTLTALDWDSEKTTPLCEVDPGTNNRFNSAKCDSSGRLWAGTMGHEWAPAKVERRMGSIYSFDSQHVAKQHVDEIDLSNGFAWSLNDRMLYHVESLGRQVYGYEFDIATETITNPRIVVNFATGPEQMSGVPAGMCIDSEGKLWVACYGEGMVVRCDPGTGKTLEKIKIPAEKTTSCCFGGPDYSEMYVTTGRWMVSDEQLNEQPLSGSVFRVTGLGVHGFAAPTYSG